jgi:hypothetical protein
MRKALTLIYLILLIACKNPEKLAVESEPVGASLVHENMKELTDVIIHDIFSPPVASRIYAYTSLAAYEALRHSENGYPSITAQLHGFPPMPLPDKSKPYNYFLSASKALFTVADKVTFTLDSLKGNYIKSLYKRFESSLEKDVYDRSMSFGDSIGKAVLQRFAVDNYKKTRGMPKFLGSNDPGKWRPTSPDYFDGVEAYWNQILPLALDSASQIKAVGPPAYSVDKNSPFYKNMYEVYEIGRNLTEEQKTIAKYWDDNPAVVEHSGHAMYINKKLSPVGHWIGINTIAAKMKNLTPIETAQSYAMTALAIFDGFISCWQEKYTSLFVRPITAIHELIDSKWLPFLQTPPFPEHTSGHSTISAAAAVILTHRFGENFAFEDTSDFRYIGMKRNFTSFHQAANEASISRVYGGIHYRTACDEGNRNGKQIGEYIVKKIRLKE